MKKEGIPGGKGGTIYPIRKGGKAPAGVGHPGGKNMSTILKEWMELSSKRKNPITGKNEALTGSQESVFALIKIMRSSKSDMAKLVAIEKILERTEGKVIQKMDFSVVEKAREVNSLFPTKEELLLKHGEGKQH